MTRRRNAPLPIPTRTHKPPCQGLVCGNIISQTAPTTRPSVEQPDQELIGNNKELPTHVDQTVQLTEPADQVQLMPEPRNGTRFMTSREAGEDDADAQVKVDVVQSNFNWQEYQMQLMVLEQQSSMRLLMAQEGAKGDAFDSPSKFDGVSTRQRESADEESHVGTRRR